MSLKRDVVINELRDRIVTGLHVGRLRDGARLPPVRQLATEHKVNERVVLGALRALADEQLVQLRPRSGAYVLAPRTESGVSTRHLNSWLVDMMWQGRDRGITPRALPDFVRRNLESRLVHAVCIECNDDQLHLLCRELSDDLGFAASGARLNDLANGDGLHAAGRADVLVTTPFHADKVRKVATTLGKPWIAVTLRPNLMRDVARYLKEGLVYYVATDPAFESKLRRMLAPFGSTENLRVMIVTRDDLSSIPASAPTYVMTSAQAHMGRLLADRGWPGRPIHPQRHLSDASVRELLTFLVSANLSR